MQKRYEAHQDDLTIHVVSDDSWNRRGRRYLTYANARTYLLRYAGTYRKSLDAQIKYLQDERNDLVANIQRLKAQRTEEKGKGEAHGN